MTSPSVSRPSAVGVPPSRVDETADADDTGDREGVATAAVPASHDPARPGPAPAGGGRHLPVPARRRVGARATPLDSAGHRRPVGEGVAGGDAARPGATAGTGGGDRPRPGSAQVFDSPAVAVTIADVEAAAASLRGVARRTRVRPDAGLSDRTGSPVWLKCEHEQHTGSFKLRGAFHRIATTDPRLRARGVVAASAGNHAQGVAFAAAHFGVPATIFVPENANPAKVARTRRLGARVEYAAGGVDGALAAAAAFAADGGRLLVHPFDDLAVVAGQGTIGLELLEQVPDLSTVVVGVGGGGLVCGLAAAIKGRRPDVRVVGVQAAAAPAFAASFQAGRRLTVPPGNRGRAGGPAGAPGTAAGTVADGMAVAAPGRLTFELAASLVDEIVTVDEGAFWDAMVLLRRAGHRVEPAGAAGVAALLRVPDLAAGPTAVVLSGGNLDPSVAATVTALAAAPATRTVA